MGLDVRVGGNNDPNWTDKNTLGLVRAIGLDYRCPHRDQLLAFGIHFRGIVEEHGPVGDGLSLVSHLPANNLGILLVACGLCTLFSTGRQPEQHGQNNDRACPS